MKHFFSVVALLLIVRHALAAPPAVPTEEFGGTIPNRPLITGHWSETANYAQYRPPAPEFVETDCPHQVYSSSAVSWSSTSAWEGGVVPTDGSDASIKNETIVLLSTGDIPAGRIYGTITIPESSALIFDDVDLELNVHGLVVRGSLQAGSLTCRLTRNITITLYGSRDAQALPAHPQVKGIAVFGSIDIHGSQYFPTWTRLAMTVESTEDVIFLQDLVNWQVGQQIVITTTELKDSRDFTHTEVRRIANIYTFADDDTVTVIQVDSPLDYQHYAGVEYQAEVALLSRDIVIQGDPDNSEPTQQETTCHDLDNPDLSPATNSTFPCADSFLDGFGGHVQVIGPESEGRFRGVELYRMGQTNQMARYPLHFHLMYEKNETTALISDCSVHRSFYRCYVIHGTNNTLVTQNTAYDAIGNCFYLSENGVEERSTISYNFAAFVHPLGNPALPSYKYANNSWLDGSGYYGQYLDFFNETQDLLIPADLSAACFYITNGYNNIFGNAAAGGWTGFSYPSLLTPIADFKNLTNFSPQGRPFMSPFRGNTAHSTGFWWASAGAFYFGGQLGYVDDEKTILQYTAGRSQTHDTCKDSTVTTGCYGDLQEWLELEDNKAFLAHRGLQAWGNRADIVRMELHDVVLSMNVFGQVWIDHLLMECRSNHTPSWMANCPAAQGDYTPDWNVCNTRDTYFFNTIRGFQWYDVGQNHILTNSVFRNCRDDWYSCYYGPSKGKCYSSVFQSLTHSDEFVPENMQVTKNITFENCGLLRAYTTANTHNPLNQTVSGRLQNWVDYDGSVSGLGVMTQIGSNRSYHWWDYSFNGSCPVADEAYTCPMGEGDGQASIFFGFDWDLQSQVGGEVCSNGDTSVPCPVVGEVIHFGREAGTGLLLGVESKLSGPVIKESAGWFINLTDGTPKEVNFSSVIIANDFQLVLALPYPAGTKLNITYEAASWCSWQWATCSIPFKETTSVGKVYNGTGNLYYFADEILYIRIVMQPSSWPQNPIFGPFLSPANFSRDGLTLYRASQSYVSIRADCDTDPCAKVNVKVPPAINPRSSAESTSTVSTTSTSTTTRPTFTAISKTTSVTVPTSTNGGGDDDDDNDHSGSGCFAASSSVRVLAGDGRILNKQLADLSVGDLVESFDGEERVFSPVYYIAHAGDEKKVNVVSLEVADTAALKLTPHHLLLVASNLLVAPELKPAGEVKVGEFLVLVSESGAMTRTKVVATKRDSEAVRNPLTLNNNIVVSGFACSAFAYSASFYSTLTRPAQILYQLLPSVFEPTSLLSLFVDALVVASDWFESKSFASAFVAATSW